MKVSIIKIGNSKGIIIPKGLIKKLGDPQEVEIEPTEDGVFIKPTEDQTRKDWEKKFSDAIHPGQESEEDAFEGLNNDFDDKEWTW